MWWRRVWKPKWKKKKRALKTCGQTFHRRQTSHKHTTKRVNGPHLKKSWNNVSLGKWHEISSNGHGKLKHASSSLAAFTFAVQFKDVSGKAFISMAHKLLYRYRKSVRNRVEMSTWVLLVTFGWGTENRQFYFEKQSWRSCMWFKDNAC